MIEEKSALGMALTVAVRTNDGKRSGNVDGIDSSTGKK
jgi:hypothetical protein